MSWPGIWSTLETTVTNTITHAPLWVWPLFIFLLWIGICSSRQRKGSMVLYYTLPFLGLMTIFQIARLPNPELAWSGSMAGFLVGCLSGYRLQRRWLIEKNHNRLTLAGEWITLLTVMIVFWANFAKGVLAVAAPGLLFDPFFLVFFTFIVGWASGSFLGRSLRVVFSPQLRL